MSQPDLSPTFHKRARPRNIPTIYCRFSSQKSLQIFQANRKSPTKLINLRNTQESSRRDPSEEDSIIANIEQLGAMPMTKVDRIYHCRKCFKELEQDEEVQGICDQCIYLSQLNQKGHFQQFVGYLLEFKTGVKDSYRTQSKIRRIESIESIQSFTLDRIHDSQVHHNSHPLHPLFNSLENTLNQSKPSEANTYGYFCDGCSAEPIVGRRFHCLECEDYDLCEKCYFHLGHKHDMKSFKDHSQEIACRAQLGAVIRSGSLQNTLPFLSQSIRNFQRATQLFRTARLHPV